MSYIIETLGNLVQQTAFFGLSWGNYLMVVVALIFLYLAIKKRIRTSASCTDFLWYASCQSLSGHHAFH